jgi:predicted RNA-binding Zn ribbon-like protein
MTQASVDVILSVLRDFREEVHQEFKAVKAKQDITNGRVNELERERDERRGYDKRGEESQALERADTLSWRALVVPAVVAIAVTAAGILAQILLG